ncbi:MAG: tripartite tricarboxylate transporter substrate binding protein [Casimicrobiaceae bacterium]|nr:tripartite tricarboxylate transporter substrate binding protein [Casimicrobiaceae bacterium]
MLPIARLSLVFAFAFTVLAQPSIAFDSLKIMIGANPGGGFDQTGRGIGKAMQDAGVVKSVQYENKGGAGGTIALAQFANAQKGDPNALIVTGAVMVGAIVQNKPPITLANATPIARLFYEYNVFVVPANSPIKSMADVIAQLKKDPGSVKWGGGSRGSVDHISVAMIAKAVGVDPAKINYVPFQGGGEASAAILGGHVTVGTSGWNEMAQFIKSGRMRALAVTSPERIADKQTPTLKEQGIDVVIGNWRGVYGAPAITPAQQKALIDAVVAGTRQKSWTDALAGNEWIPALLTGEEFGKFVDAEHKRLEELMRSVGLVK